MSILLLILKIVLIIILILLFFLLLFLFLPWRCYFILDKNEEDVFFEVSIKSFLSVVKAIFLYEKKELTHTESIFGLKIHFNSERKNNKKEKKNPKKRKKKSFDLSNISLFCKIIKEFFSLNQFTIKSIDCSYSLGEPDSTGLFSGFIATLPIIFEEYVKIEPDFYSEEAYFLGKAEAEAKICLFTILLAFIKIKLKR